MKMVYLIIHSIVECIEDTVDSMVLLQSEVAKMEDVFRGLSKTFQQMVNLEISTEEVEDMMYNMKKEKEKLVIIRTIIPTKLNLYTNLATQLVSINDNRKEILSWCSKANNFMSQCESSSKGSIKTFTEQLTQYKNLTSSMVKISTQYQSVRKVCDTILNNLKCNEGIDTSPLTTSLTDLKNTFEATTNKLEKMEQLSVKIENLSSYIETKQSIEVTLKEAMVNASGDVKNLSCVQDGLSASSDSNEAKIEMLDPIFARSSINISGLSHACIFLQTVSQVFLISIVACRKFSMVFDFLVKFVWRTTKSDIVLSQVFRTFAHVTSLRNRKLIIF